MWARRSSPASSSHARRGRIRLPCTKLVRLPAAAAIVSAAVAAASAPASAALPVSMAALGDSLTRGFGASGAPTDDPAASWSTGTDSAVSSHYLRLLAQSPGLSGHNANDAVSGSNMAATYAQAGAAVSQGAGYVTLWSGTNDVCTPTVAEMTSETDFRTQLRATLTRLTTGLPGVRILVVSIPDWYGFWQAYRGSPVAQSAWATFTDRCPDLLGAGATDADRTAVAARIVALNAAIPQVCAEFSGCSDDGGAVFALWPSLSPVDLAFDYFHLTASGQARVAETTWLAGPWAAPPPSGVGQLGNTSIGSLSLTPGAGYKFGSIFTATETGTSVDFRWYTRGGPNPQTFTPAVYAVSGSTPTTLLATGTTTTIAAGQPAGWATATLTGLTLQAGSSYLLALISGTSSNNAANYATPSSGAGLYTTNPTLTPTTTWTASASEDTRWSFYLDYTPTTTNPPPTSPPTNTSLPQISGQPETGATLTATDGTWTGTPTPTLSRQWQRCDTNAANCTDIPTATTSTYQPTPTDENHTLRITITATNTTATTTATSPPTPTITPPTQPPPPPPAPSQPNLAPDPDFEADPSCCYTTHGTASFSWASDQAHTGAHALKIVSVQPADVLTRWLSRTSAIAARAGTSYTITAWLRTDSVVRSTLAIDFWNASAAYLGVTAESTQVTGTGDWRQVTVTATAPAGTATLRLEFRLYGPGTLWADDVAATATG